jgi:hypothetical protein
MVTRAKSRSQLPSDACNEKDGVSPLVTKGYGRSIITDGDWRLLARALLFLTRRELKTDLLTEGEAVSRSVLFSFHFMSCHVAR